MKRSIVIALCVAIGLILVGGALSFCAMAAMDFDFWEMNTIKFVTNTYTVEDAFTRLSVTGAECNVRLLSAEDGICRVVCTEGDKISHTVSVQNGTLTIGREDHRRWYERIGVYWGRMELVIYLPQSAYETLFVETASGNVEIPTGFSFTEAEVQSASGDIRFRASVEGNLSVRSISGDVSVGDLRPGSLRVQATSGDVTVERVAAEKEFYVKTVSGEIELSDVSCGTFTAESTSGNVKTSGLIVSDELRIETVSGDIRLQASDAGSLWIKAVSGNVNGSLLTEKRFITDTTSGSVHVPHGASGGTCEIKTTSGNIRFTIG